MIKDTINEVNEIFKIYKDKGLSQCLNQFSMSAYQIKHRLRKYNLIEKAKNQTFDVENLIALNTPEVAYIMGLIWSDGHLEFPYRITLKASENDLSSLVPIFQLTNSHWTFNKEKRKKPTWKDQLTIRLCSTKLCKFLYELDYKAKSQTSACKILSKIPTHLHGYFFRGVIDGDGHFYCGKPSKYSVGKKVFCCDSTYEQDWTYFENLLKYLGIKYKISKRKRIMKNGRSSQSSSIEFYRIADIIKFGNFIYEGYPEDNIGFPRKYEKFKQILDYSQKS